MSMKFWRWCRISENIVYKNLSYEIKARKIRKTIIAQVLGINRKTLWEKITGRSDFTVSEASVIADVFFPDCTLDYLFLRFPGGEGD